MNLLSKMKNKIENKDYRFQAITSEFHPVFGDRFGVTNKRTVLLTEDDDLMGLTKLVSQNGEPVKFHKDFDRYSKNKYKHKGNLDFEINGVKSGMIYELKRTGYLENDNSMYEVILVTDDYVFTKLLGYGGIIIHSHNEIERFKNMNEFNIKEKQLAMS